MRLTILVTLSLLLLASPARADDEEDARAAMRRGVAAFGRGETEKALEEYETAKRLVPHANAPYLYAAEALVALGRYASAVDNLERYLAKSPDVSDAKDIRMRIAQIKAEHYLGRVWIVSNVPAAIVELDGEARGALREVALTPGKHRIELRAPSYTPVTQNIDVVGDREATLVFSLSDEAKALPSRPAQLTTSPWRTAGWIGTAAGATVLAVTLIVDVTALGPKISDYRVAASNADPTARTLRDDAASLRTLTLAGYVTGAILTAAGIGIVLFAPRTTTVAVAPWWTGSAAGLRFGASL